MNLVYDRTQSDVDYVATIKAKIRAGTATSAEITAYNAGLKGCYNYTDMNRVGSAVNELRLYVEDAEDDINDLIEEYSLADNDAYHLSTRSIPLLGVTGWVTSSIPTELDGANYITNISYLKSIAPSTSPSCPTSLSGLTYEGANNIEKIIYDVYNKFVAEKADRIALIKNVAGGLNRLQFEVNTQKFGTEEVL